MKRWLRWMIPLLLAGALFGCAAERMEGGTGDGTVDGESSGGENSFYAVVVELLDDGVIVEPREGDPIRASASRIAFRTDYLQPIEVEVGDLVWVRYSGVVRETYPAGIDALEWRLEEKGVALG